MADIEPFTLIGKRVVLVPLAEEHVEALTAAASQDRSSYGFTIVPDGRDAMEQYIVQALALRRAGEHVPFATMLDGRVVGATRFARLEFWSESLNSPQAVEIGFTWLAASAQRSGANIEAKYLQMRHAFETWGVHRVSMRTDVLNVRSQEALERLGLCREGVLRNHMPAYGRDGVRSSVIYSAIPAEWSAIKARLESRLARSD